MDGDVRTCEFCGALVVADGPLWIDATDDDVCEAGSHHWVAPHRGRAVVRNVFPAAPDFLDRLYGSIEVVVDDAIALREFHDTLMLARGDVLGCCRAHAGIGGHGIGCRIVGNRYDGLGPCFFEQLADDRPRMFGPSPLERVLPIVRHTLEEQEQRRELLFGSLGRQRGD